MHQKPSKESIQKEIDRLQGELRKTEIQEEINTLTQALQESDTPSHQKIGIEKHLTEEKTPKKGLSVGQKWLLGGGSLFLLLIVSIPEEERARILQEMEHDEKVYPTTSVNTVLLTNAQKAEVIEKMIQENTSGFLACRTIDMNYNKKTPSDVQWKIFSEGWKLSVDQVKYLAEQCGVAAKKNPPNYDFLSELLNALGGKQKGISGGMYKVGKDIPAGEYVIIGSGYLEISSDSSGSSESIIENDNYKNRTIILLKNGEYVTFSGQAYTWDDAPVLQNPTLLPEGKYKVGKDVPQGEYKVFPLSGRGGYYEINPTAREDDIISNDNFDHDIYLTIKNGQYLKLSGAELLLK